MSTTTLNKTKTEPSDEINILEKLEFLLDCLESNQVNENKSYMETIHYQLTFTEAEQLRIKAKLFELIDQL